LTWPYDILERKNTKSDNIEKAKNTHLERRESKNSYVKYNARTMMRLFAILDKAKPDIKGIRGLNLAAVKHTTVQVTRLPF
jgi:hypothetical protein